MHLRPKPSLTNQMNPKKKKKMNKRSNEPCMQLYIIWEQGVARHDNTKVGLP